MSSASNSTSATDSNSTSTEYSAALSSLKSVNLNDYKDWNTSPLGKVVKDRLSGKVALVTGASTGIGAVTARRLAAEGAKVVLFARREDKLSSLVKAIQQSGGIASYFVGDASKEEDNKKVVEFTLKTYGALHISFNNAGIVAEGGKNIWEISAEGFDNQNKININGVFYGIKHQVQAIGKSGGGVIVNNGSIVANRTFAPQYSIYSASKSWVVGYTRYAALDAAKLGVRINSVSPGPTLSDIFGEENGLKAVEQISQTKTSIGRPVKPEEIGAAVAYLASDDAQSITGIDLVIDGGFTILEQTNINNSQKH